MTTSLYAVSDYWIDGYAIDVITTASVQGPTTVQKVVGSYLYWEYNDDPDLNAFVASYNTITQQYLNTFNQLSLPVYTGPLITGALLDWVADGIYGCQRPVLSSGTLNGLGSYNSVPYNTTPYNTIKTTGTITTLVTSDDVFKRILTWNLYKGDGRIFNVQWLKRRVLRFLTGLNGTDPGIDQTNLISVTFSGANAVTINLTAFQTSQPSSQMPTTLQAAVQTGAVQLPFQFSFTVIV